MFVIILNIDRPKKNDLKILIAKILRNQIQD